MKLNILKNTAINIRNDIEKAQNNYAITKAKYWKREIRVLTFVLVLLEKDIENIKKEIFTKC